MREIKIVGDGEERVGSARGNGRGRERGGNGNVCKIEGVGDGRECKSVRESRDGGERESRW